MMLLIKRILPFVSTFALGLFLASFFVALSIPRFEHRYEYRNECRFRRMQIERENMRRSNDSYLDQLVPPPPAPPAVAPLKPIVQHAPFEQNYKSGVGGGSGSLRIVR